MRGRGGRYTVRVDGTPHEVALVGCTAHLDDRTAAATSGAPSLNGAARLTFRVTADRPMRASLQLARAGAEVIANYARNDKALEAKVREAALAKIIAADGCNEVCQKALNIFGGYGLMSEYPVQRYLRDSYFPMIGGGTSDIMRLIVDGKLLTSCRSCSPAVKELELWLSSSVNRQAMRSPTDVTTPANTNRVL